GLEGFDLLCASPWRDAGGQHHLCGRWRGTAPGSGSGGTWVVGLGRWSFPEGRVVDRVALEPIVVDAPCWFPDGSDRILFTAGDGRLYRFDFPEPSCAGSGARPLPIHWATARPGVDALQIRDPCWPTGQALGGRLVVSATYRVRADRSQPMLGSRL